jgi:hypothetical protein
LNIKEFIGSKMTANEKNVQENDNRQVKSQTLGKNKKQLSIGGELEIFFVEGKKEYPA